MSCSIPTWSFCETPKESLLSLLAIKNVTFFAMHSFGAKHIWLQIMMEADLFESQIHVCIMLMRKNVNNNISKDSCTDKIPTRQDISVLVEQSLSAIHRTAVQFTTIPYEPNTAYRVFSHDITAPMLVSQNKEMAAMLVSQTKPLGIELYFYAKTFFCFSKPIWPVVT